MPFAHSHGFKIAYEVYGEGPPLILHPGMFQIGAHWARTGCIARLAETHTVITIDPLGLGASDGPRETAAYAMAKRAEYVTAVLDDLCLDAAAFWGYSLGALTGYAVAVHAPGRITRLIAGAFDPINGFRSAIDHMLHLLDLPAGTDPYPIMLQGATADPELAAVINAADPAALRANFDAFAREPGLHIALANAGIPMFLYAGTADPWHDPLRIFAERTGATFLSLPDADHIDGWNRSAEAISHALPFMRGERDI